MRGNLEPLTRQHVSIGSIPACAGEPHGVIFTSTLNPVYPRVCGGTINRAHWVSAEKGLSPRVRGNQSMDCTEMGAYGSIPACAGEPGKNAFRKLGGRVYPRVCGGTPKKAHDPPGREGLSPRVRGNLKTAEGRPLSKGSIPVCAGEPERRPRGPGRCWVYPRVCGGTRYAGRAWRRSAGLSPRVRGNQVREHRRRTDVRSIPACAGEPHAGVVQRGRRGVYPRVCGGTGESVPLPPVGDGLSPRVRGNQVT